MLPLLIDNAVSSATLSEFLWAFFVGDFLILEGLPNERKIMYLVFLYSFFFNFVKANIAGNNKEYQYCRNKRKNVETMGEGNITPTHVRSYK